ncbi:hypothetical protein EKD04_020910 [Chloroflexales bacterium ZM16-3]|nr:hypothetical protein [Chloroflexales bacterium ZM16-3]
MTDQAAPDTPTIVVDAQVEAVLNALRADWLAALGLTDAYEATSSSG